MLSSGNVCYLGSCKFSLDRLLSLLKGMRLIVKKGTKQFLSV